MKKNLLRLAFIFHLSSFIFACAPITPSISPIVDIYATPSTTPFLDDLYACADEASVTLNFTADAPQIQLRLGELDGWTAPAWQIGTEEILIAASLQSPLPNLTPGRARELFAGRGDPSVQVWAYASGEDTQRLFESALMDGRNVASLARLAVSPSHMVESLAADPNAVGLLPRGWMTDSLRELFVVASVPLLALTPSAPEGVVRDLLACMQQ